MFYVEVNVLGGGFISLYIFSDECFACFH